ncbi:hypothetical protein N824_01830 [Pedobacter sp. V48]|nr:hypothetical protein N824_01830 [Pedobacter sp. V48]
MKMSTNEAVIEGLMEVWGKPPPMFRTIATILYVPATLKFN